MSDKNYEIRAVKIDGSSEEAIAEKTEDYVAEGWEPYEIRGGMDTFDGKETLLLFRRARKDHRIWFAIYDGGIEEGPFASRYDAEMSTWATGVQRKAGYLRVERRWSDEVAVPEEGRWSRIIHTVNAPVDGPVMEPDKTSGEKKPTKIQQASSVGIPDMFMSPEGWERWREARNVSFVQAMPTDHAVTYIPPEFYTQREAQAYEEAMREAMRAAGRAVEFNYTAGEGAYVVGHNDGPALPSDTMAADRLSNYVSNVVGHNDGPVLPSDTMETGIDWSSSNDVTVVPASNMQNNTTDRAAENNSSLEGQGSPQTTPEGV